MGGIWEELKARGYAAIDDLPGTSESLTLEFKRKTSPERPGLSDDDRRGIAETLSGMSNAVGGVLLFGIIDRKEGDLDVAEAAQDLCDVQALAGRIGALCGEVLTPVNNSVEVLPLVRPSSLAGVVAVHIGSSDNRPHMSTAAQHRRYYLRTEGANLPMLDYQIRDMLRIRTAPQLDVAYRFEKFLGQGGAEYLSITLLVENIGRVSAKHAYLLVRASREVHKIIAVENSFQPFEHADLDLRAFRSLTDQIIHPGMAVPAVRILARVRRERPEGETDISFRSENYTRATAAALHATFGVGCEDCPLTELVLALGGPELENAADLAFLGQRHALNALGARKLIRAE